MTATIKRSSASRTGTATDNNNGGRQPAQKNITTDSPTQGGLGDLVFSVTKGEVPQPKRGGKTATIQIPATILNAFDSMIKDNPTSDEKSMAHVGPVQLTNEQIQQFLVQGLTKMERRLPARDQGRVKSSITVTDDSPNKRSVDKANKDKKVEIVWTVRLMNDDEVAAREARKRERETANASA